jgi:hypothetical protein
VCREDVGNNQIVSSDSTALPRHFARDLEADEIVMAFARARLPRVRTARATFMSIHFVVEVIDSFRNRRKMREVRARGHEVDFPLDQRIAMAVTNRRLLIWRAVRVGAPTLIGSVPRERITSAVVPYVGGGWRTVEIGTVEGLAVRFLVANSQHEGFVAALTQAH